MRRSSGSHGRFWEDVNMKDAVATMGDILPDDVGGRDAVHVAVIAVSAGEKLTPGQDVGFSGELTERQEQIARAALATVDPIGIVDPFLKGLVWPGQRFWLYLYPRTITSLRHQWTHPAFAEGEATASYSPPSQQVSAEQWMRDFADRVDLGYSTVLEAGHEAIRTGDYFVQQDRELARNAMYEPNVREAYWRNFEIITGVKPDKDAREHTVFSCSC